jgi:hypothetical protein
MIVGIAREDVRVLSVHSNEVPGAVDDEKHIQGALRQALCVLEEIPICKMGCSISI